MKRFLFFLFLLFSLPSFGQVFFTTFNQNTGGWADYDMALYFDSVDGKIVLVSEVVSNKARWSQTPVLQIKFDNDSVFRLSGFVAGSNMVMKGSWIEVLSLSSQILYSSAYFPVNDNFIKCLGLGIKKIRPALVPHAADAVWKNGKIGEKLKLEYLRFATREETF